MLLYLFLAVSLLLGAGAFWAGGKLWLLPVGFIGGFLGMLILLFLVVLVMSGLVDMKKPQRKDSPFYRWIVHQLMILVFPVLGIRFRTQGLEKAPVKGPCLVVCNHVNDLDPAFLMKAFPQLRLAFISKRENDQKFLIGPFLHKLMGQPINRENNREALKTIINCVNLLGEGHNSVAVFPEGYVSLDRKLRPFRSGVFKIAQRAKVPIVVCTLRNTYKVLHNAKRLKKTDVHLHLLAVIQPEELVGVTTVEIGNRIHTMMAADLGPELVFQE